MHNGWKGATRPGSPGAHKWATMTVLGCYPRSTHNIMQYHKVCKLSLTESSVTSGTYLCDCEQNNLKSYEQILMNVF